MAQVSIADLATEDINLSDFFAKADASGLASKNTIQNLGTLLETVAEVGFKGRLMIADTPTVNGWYLAGETGTFTNAGGLVVSLSNNVAIIIKNDASYTKIDVPITVTLDSVPTNGSTNGIESNAVFDGLAAETTARNLALANQGKVLKDAIDNAVFDGAKTYQTVAELPTSPVPANGTPAKVANNVADPTKNGNWSVVSGVWVQDASVVSNIANSADIRVVGNELQFAPRNKTLSTLGYLKTPANFDFADIDNVGLDYSDYILEIGYNYNLGGATITLPENIVLDFKGGKFSNGTIVGNNSKINAELVQIFDSNITLSGTFNLTEIYPEWFGVKKDGTDDSLYLQKTFNFAELTCKKIVFSKGEYLISSNISIKTTGLQSRLILKAEDRVVFKAGYNGDILTIGDASYENTQNGYGFFTLENFNFEHNGFTGATAIRVRSQKNIIFKDIYISGNWLVGISLKGVYATPTLENVRITGANTGIITLGQVNNILYTRCAFLSCQIGFHASPLSGVGLSSGELDTNTFNKCDFEGNVKSILIDSPSGCTNLIIDDNHFEGNTGTEIQINNKTTLNVNCNINSISIINNLFYSFNEVLIGNSNSGGNLLNVTFENNHVIYGAENSVKVCTEVGNLAFNVNNIKNNYVNISRTQVEKPYTAPLLMSKTFEGGIGVMNRYNKQPVLPFGSGDAKGEISDIRFDNENLYVKTYDGGWRYIPLGIIGTYPNTKKSTSRLFAAPTTGTWNKNDTVWNEDVSAGGYIGWVCVTSGTPGTWKGFGLIQA